MRNNVTRSLRIAEKINDWPSSRKSIIAKANRGPRVPIHWADGCRTVENRVVLTCCVLVRVRGDDNTQREGKKGKGKRRNAVYARGQETNELPRSFLSLPIPELHKLKAKLSTLGDARSAGACVGAKKLVGKNLCSLFRSLARLNTRVHAVGEADSKKTDGEHETSTTSARRTRLGGG